MILRLLAACFSVLITSTINAQQLSSWSSFHETGFVWNPAMAARYTQWEVSGTHRQEWLGFDDAPQITTLSFQIPFYQRFYTASTGGIFLERDQVGPFDNYTLNVTYAYKFRPNFQKKGISDELSLGFSLNASRYEFNTTSLTPFDNNEASFLYYLDEYYQSIIPNISLGAFYSSRNATQNYNKSFYFAGFSVNQLAPLNTVTIKLPGDRISSWNIRSQPHILVNAGYRHYIYRSKNFIEANIMTLYSLAKSMHAMASYRYEIENAWWLSGGGVTNGELFMQTGVIIGPKSKLKNIVKDGSLRIGVKGDFHLGKISLYSHTGYELFMAYTFEVNAR